MYKLRIFLDAKYPGIAAEALAAARSVAPQRRARLLRRPSNCFEVFSYSRSWACLFPQHGTGPKHARRIWLAPWQQELAERSPESLLRGLVHSDGSRSLNNRGAGETWSAPRYAFANRSTDITSIFCSACDHLGLRWTASFPKDQRRAVNIYVSRKADVARMDGFIGPKA